MDFKEIISEHPGCMFIKMDPEGNIIPDSIDSFIYWYETITCDCHTLKSGEGVYLRTAHYIHILNAIKLFDMRVKMLDIDPKFVTELRQFLYGMLDTWVRAGKVMEIVTGGGNGRIYSCKCNFPGLIKYNTWEEYICSEEYKTSEEYLSGKSSSARAPAREPPITEEKRAMIEKSLLEDSTINSCRKTKVLSEEQLEAAATRATNAIRDQKKKEKAEFERISAIAGQKKLEAQKNKQRAIAKAKIDNARKCAAAVLASKEGKESVIHSSMKVGGGPRSVEESKDNIDE
jgi:hypothetical protein